MLSEPILACIHIYIGSGHSILFAVAHTADIPGKRLWSLLELRSELRSDALPVTTIDISGI